MSVGGGSVGCDAVHDPVIECSAIDGGCKARLITHTLWVDAAGGNLIAQTIAAQVGNGNGSLRMR